MKTLARVLAVTTVCGLAGCAAQSERDETVRRIERRGALANHPEWPEEIRDAVERERIVAGMSDQQLLASWGKPSRITRSSSPYGAVEHWHYQPTGLGDYRTTVTVTDGVVTWWHQTEPDRRP